MKPICWVDALKLKLTLPSLYWCAGYSWWRWANSLHGVCVQHGHKSSVVLLGRILSCAPYCSFSWIYHKLQILFIFFVCFWTKKNLLFFCSSSSKYTVFVLNCTECTAGWKVFSSFRPLNRPSSMIGRSQAFLLIKTVYLTIQVSPSLPSLTHSLASQPQHVPLAKGTLLLILLLSFDVSYCEPRLWTLWYTQEWGRYSGKNLRKT